MRVLYISYSGLMEPLGQSQVLQYLKKLSHKHDISLVTFEKAEDWRQVPRRVQLHQEVLEAGIHWVPLRYHSRPSALATIYDIMVGLLVSLFIVFTLKIKIIHSRSYVASTVALAVKKILGTRFVFDMRGFWADERVDGNIWPKDSKMYRVAKWFERKFFLNADVVVSLTQAGVDAIEQFSYLQERMPRFVIIPTCTNLENFNFYEESKIATSNSAQSFTLGYVGSVGTWYLLDEMLQCFKVLLKIRPDARMIFINKNDHQLIFERVTSLKVPIDHIEVRSALYSDVAKEMSNMHAGIFFYKPDFSKKATSPTKLGESLACGLPCIGNTGVGDVESILISNKVGVVVDTFDEEAIESALGQLLQLCEIPDIRERCRCVAESYYSLNKGVYKYDAIYQSLNN